MMNVLRKKIMGSRCAGSVVGLRFGLTPGLLLFLAMGLFLGCGKLDLKPESGIVLPSTVKDLELLMDNTDIINRTPALPQVSADEYFIPGLEAYFSLPNPTARNGAVWAKDIYGGEVAIQDWQMPYKAIFYANNVLEVIAGQESDVDGEKQVLRGWALFVRAYSHFSLLGTFAPAYDAASAGKALGVPLKLRAGVDELVGRSTVAEGYAQVIGDAVAASELLQKDIIAGKRNRPSKVAAYALLARVYLSMRDYINAEKYADMAWAVYSRLTDYNTLSKTVNSFTFDSEEVIYFTEQLSLYTEITGNRIRTTYGIDTELLALYAPNDLRLVIYYQKNTLGNFNTKPINSLGTRPFTGLATDEILLIRAECLARRGEVSAAMALLDELGTKRWNPAATVPAVAYPLNAAETAAEALDKVLIERRRALVWRSLRWMDLRRLNLEGRDILLRRTIGDQVYRLEPNSARYVMPVPDDEIALSGIAQNER